MQEKQAYFAKCCNCNSEIESRGEAIEYNNEWYCESCQDDYLSFCDECGETVWTDDAVWLEIDESIICSDCNDNAYHCTRCNHGTISPNINGFFIHNGDWLCNGCYENGEYISCENCSDIYHVDDMVSCDECDCYYCANCYEDDNVHDCLIETNNSKKFYLTKIDGELITTPRTLGVEIEAEQGERGVLRNNLPKECNTHLDGSLDSTGVELVTMPANRAEFERIVKTACQAMQEADFVATDHCGLHIHLDGKDFKDRPRRIAKLYRTFYAVERMLYKMVKPRRWHNSYCAPLSQKWLFNELTADITKRELQNTLNSKMGKYQSLNINCISWQGTIEVRMHHGTVDANEIIQWAAIMSRLVDYARYSYKSAEVIRLFNIQDPYKKAKRMYTLFKLPKQTYEYINNRLDYYNNN